MCSLSREEPHDTPEKKKVREFSKKQHNYSSKDRDNNMTCKYSNNEGRYHKRRQYNKNEKIKTS